MRMEMKQQMLLKGAMTQYNRTITNNRSKMKNRVVWLDFLMFATGLFSQAFHNDMGFQIAGGTGLIVGFIGFTSGYIWDK